MSWPYEWTSGYQDYVEYKMGCPTKPNGVEELSEKLYNTTNPLCANDKCVCVLENEPRVDHKEDQPEFIKVPSVTGKWRTLKHRYKMPKLTDKFVDAVRNHTEGTQKME